MQWHEENGVSRGLGCALQLKCLHRLYLIPTGHEKVVAPKNENTLALIFTRLSGGQFGVAPNTRNIGLEGYQSGMWWWVASREGRTKKQERETCGVFNTYGFAQGMDLEI